VGGGNLLIAARAASLGFTLIRADERDFARIDDLHCGNRLA
jgi:predicted nucleic acid-binding protein